MVDILGVYAKDVHARLDISSEEVKYLIEFLNRCKIEFDGEKEVDVKEAVDYVTGTFFKKLEEIEEHMKGL